ncbi:MAG: transporter substrate-binding domain-containing protein [Thiohalomonadaceae bacterium]
MRSGSEYDYPPFSVVRADGSADGFSVELLRAVLGAMGHEVEFKVGPWHQLKAELADGRLQVLPLMARTERRSSQYDFSVPYFTMHGAVVVRRGDRRIRGVDDLRGREVIVMRDDIADEYVQAHGLTDRIFRTDTLSDALLQLSEGRHDAVVVQKLAGQALIKHLGISNLEIVGAPIGEFQQFCFAVREGDHELLAIINEGLALTVADGTYARLMDKWLAPVQESRAPHVLVVLAVVVTLVVAWFVALAWQRSLLRVVQARTAELQAANRSLKREIEEHHNTEKALRRTTEELEAMFSNTHVMMAIMDREFNFLRVNAAYAAATRRKPEDFIGVNHFTRYPDRENEAIFREVVATGEVFTVAAKPFQHPDQPERGTTYWDWTLTPVKGANGEVEAVVLALIDATEREQKRQEAEVKSRISRRLLEQRVHDRTAELEAAYQELETFSYSVSHDLRGPLRAINGFSHVLAEELGDAVQKDSLDCIARIQDATVRMGDLIDGLLNLAQVFRSELQRTCVDLSALATEVMAMLPDMERAGPAEIRIQPGVSAQGDPTLLRALLQNLLENALKFSRQREDALIEFGTEQHDGKTVYYVRDNGMGFDMQYAHKLFKPFERLHGIDGFEGNGIGLATVRRIVLRHRGRVWAEGSPGEGATVYFTLNDL